MSTRVDRVAEGIRRLTCEIIQSGLKDPRLKGIITVTKVKLTADLRFARIYYSVLGDDKNKKLVGRGLKSATPYIRKRIADRLKLRYAPSILFKVDEYLEYAGRIDEILDKLHREG
ncbi:MAG: ribosome-binding factor A, partial [Nitrospirae bacterium RBG_13_43_8]